MRTSGSTGTTVGMAGSPWMPVNASMGSEDGLQNMNDSRLKPWLLHSIMATHLPDDKQPTRAPIQLSVAVASIRRHHLLSENSMHGVVHVQQGAKSMDVRKGAVEAWIDRLMGLLASSVAENRWAGICLLGVTCQECSRQRFLDSYSTWFQKLLLSVKQPTDPIFVRAAACASLSDVLTRLGSLIDYAGVRRDAGPLVGKLVQPVMQILSDKESSGIWNEALDLLCVILKYFPSCVRQQFNQAELLLVAQLVDGDCTASLSQKSAQSLALLPRAHGDASSWSSLMRRLLIAVNNELDAAFAGLEDPADAAGVFSPVNQDAPWPTVCQPLGSNGASVMLKSYWQQLVPRVSSILHCCCSLLVSSYPVPVTVPIGPLLTVVMRILHVDGSRVSSASLGIPISTTQQASLCSELPTLHLSALDLLFATVRATRSQLLPHAADVVRILSDYSKRNTSVLPSIKIKLYGISQHLILMGAGMASALAPAVVAQALCDLKGSSPGSGVFSPKGVRTPRMNNPAWTQGSWGGGPPVNHRKRKEPGSFPCDHQVHGTGDAVFPISEGGDPVSVQVAALQAMEALLTSGGALLPDRWRAEVDAVLANVAVSASVSSMSLAVDEELMAVEGITSGSSVAFQVAAYRALLASLLSPCCHRPPHLAQGLAIFRKGRQEAGTEVAEVCAHALLSLEPLIHPRCLPPAGTPAAVVAGMATGRATAGGSLISMQRPGRASVAAGSSVAAVSGAAAILGFPVTVVPPALKIGQLAMDPWAEVDTWLGYGEEFGEEENLFYETDVVLEDDFNEGLAGAVGTPVGAFYGTDTQNAQPSGVSKLVGRADEAVLSRVDSGLVGLEDRQLLVPSTGEELYKCQQEGEAREMDVSPGPQEQMDGPYIEQKPLANGMLSPAVVGQSDANDAVKGDMFHSSNVQVGSGDKDLRESGSLGSNTGDDEIVAGMPTTDSEVLCEQNRQSSVVGGSLSVLTPASTSDVFPGPDSDSDGPLPDIVDADPDSG